MSQNVTYDRLNTVMKATDTASACAPSWVKLPVYTRPPWPTPLNFASAGSVKSPQDSVPQIPARPCALSAPMGSSSHLSMASTPYTTMTPATAPMITAAQGCTYPDG